MPSGEERSFDPAAQELIDRAAREGRDLAWDRYAAMQPQCGFGKLGLCCRICHMGPCRIDPFGQEPQRGVCGADADTIAARHLLRMIAAGAAAHSDHGRDVAHALLVAATNPDSGYTIKDERKLLRLAEEFGIETKGRQPEQVAVDLAHRALAEFGRQEGQLTMPRRAPQRRQEIWERLGIWPRSIDREIVQILHQTTMGVDADYRSLIMQGLRAALADGWGGSMIATDLQDVLFGSPEPIRARTNLGVLKEDHVNLIVHGHEPVLSEMIVEAARSPELVARAQQLGARGINVAGLCCTGNEILMRQGIPSAGSFLHQELAVLTGAVEAMVVDVQCWMPALSELTSCFHTKLVTTSPKAKLSGVQHIEFSEERALEVAKQIVALAVDNYPNRQADSVFIPDWAMDLVGGFTAEYVYTLLGGRFRPSYRPLNNAIIEGRIRGVVGIVGCENPELPQGACHVGLTQELIANDVLVVATGCSALASARAGLLRPEAALEMAGPGLREVCEAVGMPPVLHVGSCVDNSRILIACCNMVAEGGLGEDIADLPVAGAAPEWMSEKAIAIGFYCVASGIFTVFGTPHPVLGAPNVTRFITEELDNLVGGRFAFEPDPDKAAALIIDHLNQKRRLLRLEPMMYARA
jgi:carbon-monoxide dehydrogenase catalytic subunit